MNPAIKTIGIIAIIFVLISLLALRPDAQEALTHCVSIEGNTYDGCIKFMGGEYR